MDKVRLGLRLLLTWAGAAVIGGIASGTVLIFVTPGPWRDAFLLLIWPLVIIVGTVMGWRWLGVIEGRSRGRAYVAITEIIESGKKLRERLAKVSEPEGISTPPEGKPWEIRVEDWTSETERVVTDVAPDRLQALLIDPIYSDVTVRDVPRWVGDLLLTLDVRIERLVLIRATL